MKITNFREYVNEINRKQKFAITVNILRFLECDFQFFKHISVWTRLSLQTMSEHIKADKQAIYHCKFQIIQSSENSIIKDFNFQNAVINKQLVRKNKQLVQNVGNLCTNQPTKG